MTRTRQHRVLRRIHTLAQICTVILRHRLGSSTHYQGVQPLRECTRPEITQTPTTQACGRMIYTTIRVFLIRFFCFTYCHQIINDQRSIINLRMRRINRIFNRTVPRQIIQTRRTINIKCHHRILIRRLLLVSGKTGLRRMRQANTINIRVTYGLGLRKSTRDLYAMTR